jgi:hypothetical protein
MNILSQIIPGIRDARTPLAVGILWGIVAWVACSLMPKEVWQSDAFSTLGSQAAKVPTEAAVGLVALLAYLLGVFMQSVGQALTRLVRPAILVGLGILLFFLLVRVLAGLAFVVFILSALCLLAVAALRHHRLQSKGYWRTFEDTLTDTGQKIFIYMEREWRKYRAGGQAYRSELEEITNESLEEYYASHQGFLDDRVEELTHSSLHQAALSVGVTLEEAYAEGEREVLPPELKSLADVRLHLADSEVYDENIRRALRKKLGRDREARNALAQVLDLSGYRDWLRRRLDQADHELRSSKPELYLEYDRIRAEGQFRSGVAFPLAALIAVLSYKWHLSFNANNSMYPLAGLLAGALAVWLVVDSAGTSHENNARFMLYAAVRNKTIELPQAEPFGELIFVVTPLPNIKRSATVRSAVKRKLRELVRKPFSRFLPELTADNYASPVHVRDSSADLEGRPCQDSDGELK